MAEIKRGSKELNREKRAGDKKVLPQVQGDSLN